MTLHTLFRTGTASPGVALAGSTAAFISIELPSSRRAIERPKCASLQSEPGDCGVRSEHANGIQRDRGQIRADHLKGLGHNIVRHGYYVASASIGLKYIQDLAYARPQQFSQGLAFENALASSAGAVPGQCLCPRCGPQRWRQQREPNRQGRLQRRSPDSKSIRQ